MELKGKTALVTGASSGLGYCFAEQLAARGVDLVITARRAERLEKLAAGLSDRYSVQVTCIPQDLSESGAAKKLFDQTEGAGRPVDILINNAGFASFGPFSRQSWGTVNKLILVDILALTELTHRFIQAMHSRNRGYILNVSSFAAYMPVPGYAAYAAAKTYVRNFTEALAHEIRKTPVRACCLCPGATATEFWEVAGQKRPPFLIRATMSSPRKVARTGLKALFRRRRNVVSGFLNKLVVWLTRFSPRRFAVRLAALVAGGGQDQQTSRRNPP
jgi:short-subunit dehydrogenase